MKWYPSSSQVGIARLWGCPEDLSSSSGSSRTSQLCRVTSCDITSWCQAHSAPNRVIKEGLRDALQGSYGEEKPPQINPALFPAEISSNFISTVSLHSVKVHYTQFFFIIFFYCPICRFGFNPQLEPVCSQRPQSCSQYLIVTECINAWSPISPLIKRRADIWIWDSNDKNPD